MASQPHPGLAAPGRAFVTLMQTGFRHHHRHEVFRDFCELAAITLSNAVDQVQFDEREARYMDIIRRYAPDEASRFAELLALVVEALEVGFSDVLGNLFMQLELGDHWKGQFFTPYEIARLMARLTLDEASQKISQQGYITVQEPAVGAGAMVIAMADELQGMGHNYQQTLHVTAIDLDLTAVHMAYIQLSLLHVPAVLIHGNSLTMALYSQWHTPAHIMGGWGRRLKANALPAAPEVAAGQASTAQQPDPVILQPVVFGQQLDMFS